MSGDTITIAHAIASCPPGNGLTELNTYSLDYELATAAAKDGAANVCSATLARTDNLNITGITDAVTPANTQSLAYSAANRLNSASGAYGAYTLDFPRKSGGLF